MKNKLSDFNKAHIYLDIPYSEHTVPFPNFHTVLNQHVQQDSGKICIISEHITLSYPELKSLIQKFWTYFKNHNIKSKQRVAFSFTGHALDYVFLLALWDYGCIVIPKFPSYSEDNFNELLNASKTDYHLFFKGENKNIKCGQAIEESSRNELFTNVQQLEKYKEEIPFIHLTAPALDYYSDEFGSINFSVYNILNAAQALGKHFQLFRPGNTVIPNIPETLSDLMLNFLAPYYYAKTIEIPESISLQTLLNRFQNKTLHYTWCKTNENYATLLLNKSDVLRSAQLLLPYKKNQNNLSPVITMFFPLDIFSGMGSIISGSPELSVIHSTEVEFNKNGSKLRLRGHSLFDRFLNDNPDVSAFKNGWYEENF